MKVCDVYLSRATRSFDTFYTYLPPKSGQDVEPGCVVRVPFGKGNSIREAWVWQIRETQEDFVYELKHILEIVSAPLLRADHFKLAREMRRRYFCSTSQALQVMAPVALRTTGAKTARFSRLTDPEEALDLLEEGALRSLGQIRVLELLLDVGEASIQEIMATCQVSRSVLDGLRKKGYITNFSKKVKRVLPEEPAGEEYREHTLNPDQARALEAILHRAKGEGERYQEFLLHGVTGSGKTEVYLRAAEHVLAEGKSVIILVPEISLTPLICARIQARFDKSAAILHSRLSAAERYEHWRSIRSGEKRLVAGARSAIFAPLENIGLIIVDEEQEDTYKAERTPRYHAVDIARLRAAMHGAKLVLASATPSLISYERTQSGKSSLLWLPQRAGGATIPETSIVNMRDEFAYNGELFLSRALRANLRESFARKEQAMIFLNRRGHSSFIMCRDCGYTMKCSNCDVNMTEHVNPHARSQHLMICHYCGAIKALPRVCPECSSEHFGRFGIGTQQAEQLLQEAFPEQRFLRMDYDTTSGRQAHARILAAFAHGEADCLIGTQMIAKGHDFPLVTTVGILSADILLAQDDYAADERAFQLICQAAGRAGRSEHKGQVLIQTFQPDHFAICSGARQDYGIFFAEERQKRKVLHFPPFCDLGLILVSSRKENLAAKTASKVYRELQHLVRSNQLEKTVMLYEAQVAPIAKLRRRWRYRLIVKSRSLKVLTQVLTYANDLKLPEGVTLACDVNPTRMT